MKSSKPTHRNQTAKQIAESLPGCKKNGTGWMACCPSHDDTNPSLSISDGDDGRVLLKCFAGCKYEQIIGALGLGKRDLMPPHGTAPAITRRKTTKAETKTFPTAEGAIAVFKRKLGTPDWQFPFHNAAGEVIGYELRWDENANRPKKETRPVSRGPDGRWRCKAMDEPMSLYRLLDIAAADSIFVQEGARKAYRMDMLGFTATASMFGSDAPRKSDWSPLAGKTVFIMPDNDEPGEKYKESVCGMLSKLTPTPTVYVLKLPDLPDGGDVVDYVYAQHKAGKSKVDIINQIKLLAESAERVDLAEKVTGDGTDGAPSVLRYEPFPVRALPDAIQSFVEAVAATTGTDPSFAAIAALTTMAGCIGNRVALTLRSGFSVPAILWGGIVGKSGCTKSPVLKLVTRPLIEIFKEERSKHADAMEHFAREMQEFEADLARWKQDQKRTNSTPTDPPVKPEPPTEKRITVSDITIEKLGALLEQNPLGLLLARDELAAWIGAFDRYSAGKGSDQPAWLSMFDGAPLVIDRKVANGSYFVERAAVSVIGSIQPATLARVFGRAEREAGLLARVLLVNPPDRVGRWSDAGLPDHVAGDWRDLLIALTSIQPNVDEDGSASPRFIGLDPDAKRAFADWYNATADEMTNEADDDLRAYFAKLRGACARLALIFTCANVAAGGDPARGVGLDAMRRAIAIADWFKHEGRRVYGVFAESEDDGERRELIGWIRRRGGSATLRDLTHGPRKYRGKTAEAKDALDSIEADGLGEWTHPAPGPTGGKPSAVFVLFETGTSGTGTDTPRHDSATAGFSTGASGATQENADEDWIEI